MAKGKNRKKQTINQQQLEEVEEDLHLSESEASEASHHTQLNNTENKTQDSNVPVPMESLQEVEPSSIANSDTASEVDYAPVREYPYSVFITGKNIHIRQIILKSDPLQFEQDFTDHFGDCLLYQIRNYLKVCCSSKEQQNRLLDLHKFGEDDISVTLPWSAQNPNKYEKSIQTRNNTRAQNYIKVVLKGIPLSLTDDQIRHETESIGIRRIQIKKEGILVPSTTVIATFSKEQPPPQYLYIGFMRFSHEPYIPPPLRCDNCQAFGHHKSRCKYSMRCSHCSEAHSYTQCNNKDKPPKCTNCGGKHSAAYKKCEAYLITQHNLDIKDTSNTNIRPQVIEQHHSPTITSEPRTYANHVSVPAPKQTAERKQQMEKATPVEAILPLMSLKLTPTQGATQQNTDTTSSNKQQKDITKTLITIITLFLENLIQIYPANTQLTLISQLISQISQTLQ